MSNPWYCVGNEETIPSPALLFYRERIEENIKSMITVAGGPERLRPHVKTHKIPELVKLQIEAGITKFKCATIAEAEMTATAGASEVMLAFPLAGPAIYRFLALVRMFPVTNVSTIVDSEATILALSNAAQAAGAGIEVFLDIDCGMHRTGVIPDAEAVRLYRLITHSPGLRIGGLHAYDGHIREPDLAIRTAQCETDFAPVVDLKAALLKAGLPVPSLIAGGSPTLAIHARYEDRDLSPGTTVLWDFGYGDRFSELPFQPAAALLTRVISKPGPNRLCIDLGVKAVAAETPPPRVRLLEIPDATAVMHSEEHLVVETRSAERFNIGDCLHGLPYHVCPTVALHSEALIVYGGKAVDRWSVIARNRRLTV